jgi:hypothetical protein
MGLMSETANFSQLFSLPSDMYGANVYLPKTATVTVAAASATGPIAVSLSPDYDRGGVQYWSERSNREGGVSAGATKPRPFPRSRVLPVLSSSGLLSSVAIAALGVPVNFTADSQAIGIVSSSAAADRFLFHVKAAVIVTGAVLTSQSLCTDVFVGVAGTSAGNFVGGRCAISSLNYGVFARLPMPMFTLASISDIITATAARLTIEAEMAVWLPTNQLTVSAGRNFGCVAIQNLPAPATVSATVAMRSIIPGDSWMQVSPVIPFEG